MSTETFTSPGLTNWTCPANVYTVTVELWAGGSGGANGTSTQGRSGGGAGAYSKGDVSVTPGNVYSVFVGAGSNHNATGTISNGGDSYFLDTSTVLAKGGGAPLTTSGGQGGLASAGIGTTTKHSGGCGAVKATTVGGGGGGSGGNSGDGTYATTATVSATAGTGDGAGGAGGSGSGVNGANGTAPGGGGGGGGGTSANGGDGANGQAVLTYTTVTDHLTMTTQPAAKTNQGVAFGAVVTAMDATPATDAGFTGNVTVAITTGTGAPSPTLSGTTTVAAIAGVATFTGLSINKSDFGYTPYSLTFTASGVATVISGTFSIASTNNQQSSFFF